MVLDASIILEYSNTLDWLRWSGPSKPRVSDVALRPSRDMINYAREEQKIKFSNYDL